MIDERINLEIDKALDRRIRFAAVWAFGCCSVLFAPLLLAGLEEVTTDTQYVQNVCRATGIHGALTAIYTPVLTLIRLLIPG
jgi:hypothetical protein